ncbi:MAG: hypothetical protein PHQ36_01030 [Anaerolineales bacterium]|nr:hypothetical protein [Anaerolineales bacterium]
MNRRILLIGLISILLTSCAATTPAPTSIPPTNTPPPTSTATLVPPTSTPIQLTLRVTNQLINCRYGPGIVYALASELKEGQSARVIGRDKNSMWWYIRDPGNPDGRCWVSASVTKIQGEAEELPVINPPAVKATKINLRIEPARIIVACSQFPQTVFFETEITANGPTLVVWRLESSAGYTSAEHTLIFEEAGAQTANGYYQVPVAGDYWLKVRVLKPNDIAEQLNFPANCTP